MLCLESLIKILKLVQVRSIKVLRTRERLKIKLFKWLISLLIN